MHAHTHVFVCVCACVCVHLVATLAEAAPPTQHAVVGGHHDEPKTRVALMQELDAAHLCV